LIAWEMVVTVLTVVMVRQHLGLAVTVAVIDLASGPDPAGRQGPVHQPGRRDAPTSVRDHGLGGAALITLVGAVVAVVTTL